MKLLELIIENFRGFKKARTFYFADGPGLFFMQGRNEEEPRLGSNGAGKSSVWEALCWLFFERTSRGLKAGSVGNWDVGKGASVTLAFQADDGAVIEVKRTWKPNTWTMLRDTSAVVVDLTKDKTNALLAQLRLEVDPFLNCVLMAQSQPMFLDMSPEPKAALFSSVMGLDKWLSYSTDAGKRASEQDRISRRLESQLAELQGRYAGIDSENVFLSSLHWEEDHKEQLDRLERVYEEKLMREKALKVRMQDADAARGRSEDRRRDAVLACDDFAPAVSAARTAARKAQDDLIELRRDLEHAAKHRSAASEGTCSACSRPFDRSTINEMESSAYKTWARAKDEFADQQEKVNELASVLDAATHREEKLADARDKAGRAADDAHRDFVQARQAYDIEARALDQLEDELHDLQDKPNPFTSMLVDQHRNLDKLRDEINAMHAKLDHSNARYAMFTFWVKGFKEVRLQLIAEALDELEVEVNSEVMALGLADWELRFDVDKETKSGKLSRGFSVSVISPHNSEPVPWEAWSGGEAQRLRVAAQMGLSNLIRTRTGAMIDLEVWDEPTKELSEEGVTDLLNALADRARRECRQIWIVDHRSHGYGGFAGGATVVKDQKGSRFVQTTV